MQLHFSHKIASLSPSPTVALNSKAKELAQKGAKVFNFAVGEPDFSTPESITNVAIESLKKGRTKYSAAGGSLALREAIGRKLKRDNGIEYTPNQIVAGVGAKEILFHLALALFNEGDEVIIPAPYWVSYTAHLEAIGAKPVIIPIPNDHRSTRLTPEMMEPYVTPRTRALILNSPNNPAGYILKREELAELGRYLVDKPWWIIGDEIYEYMAFDTDHISLVHLEPALKDRYILVNGLSKGFAMTGWRVGYMAGPLAVAKLVSTLQTQSSTCLPPFIEDAAAYALDLGREAMADKLRVLQNRRDLAVSCLGKIEAISMIPAEGAFYIFIDIREALARAKGFVGDDSLKFSEYLLERYQVAMVPGEAFGVPGFLRLSYAVNEEDIEQGIARIGEALSSLC